jgi:hypothetical protein
MGPLAEAVGYSPRPETIGRSCPRPRVLGQHCRLFAEAWDHWPKLSEAQRPWPMLSAIPQGLGPFAEAIRGPDALADAVGHSLRPETIGRCCRLFSKALDHWPMLSAIRRGMGPFAEAFRGPDALADAVGYSPRHGAICRIFPRPRRLGRCCRLFTEARDHWLMLLAIL